MGTNYYLHTNICRVCKRYDERHIGKSSGGWCFGLHVYPEDGINTLEDWKTLFKTGEIYDEEGHKILPEEMIDIITIRDDPTGPGCPSWYEKNHAEFGPNDLARHKIDGRFCIGHSEGTWDYLIGEFS